jgi:hypothetical protein
VSSVPHYSNHDCLISDGKYTVRTSLIILSNNMNNLIINNNNDKNKILIVEMQRVTVSNVLKLRHC